MPGMVATEFAQNARRRAARHDVVRRVRMCRPSSRSRTSSPTSIEHPVAEVYTNPASADMARRYFADVGAFEQARRESRGSRPPPAVRR